MISARAIMNINRTRAIMNALTGRADEAALKVAEDLAERIKDSMPEGGHPHMPSMPGSPPARLTHELVNSVTAQKSGKAQATVTVGASYAAELEYGTARVAARPFMRPAIDATSQHGVKIASESLGQAFNAE